MLYPTYQGNQLNFILISSNYTTDSLVIASFSISALTVAELSRFLILQRAVAKLCLFIIPKKVVAKLMVF